MFFDKKSQVILFQQYSLLYSTDILIRKFICCFLDSGVSQDVKPEVTVSKREFNECDSREC